MDYLVQHALDNIWCSPRQDRQFILRPKRISEVGGAIVQLELDWIQVYLPDNKNYYHIYQIGNLHADFLGLHPVKNQWISLQDVSNKMGMIADAYSAKGILLPKFETYYMVTTANNLIVASRKREKLLPVDFNTEDLFLRVYTNAFFQSPRSWGLSEKIVVKGASILLPQDILTMQTEFMTYRAKTPGYAYAVINGFFSEEISPLTCKVGDLVHWVYDGSVAKAVEFEINYLPDFDSTMDSERKYLLHYPGNTNNIDYQDDVDLFLVERIPDKKPNGLYHHKNTAVALRQVTHKDYSMSVALINAFVDGHPVWETAQPLRVLMLVRNGGYNRPLVYENNRIHELYKLKEVDWLPAVVGDNAAVPNWHAATLEASGYTKIMGEKKIKDITRPIVQDALGYNAISKLLGDVPLKVETINGIKMVKLPRGLYENATAYEYDANGLLLGWYYHDVGTDYIVTNQTAALVEVIVGKVDHQLDENYDLNTQPIDPKLNYRMYVCDKIGGVPQHNWRDVTATGQYAIVNNQLTWLINMTNFATLVRSDKNALGYVQMVASRDGLIKFDITRYAMRNGQLTIGYLEVPLGELDLIMNGRSLLEKTDYVVQRNADRITVVIHNKRYLLNPTTQQQEVAIRFSGFCKADLTREIVEDRGWVKWELLSRNSTYNIRDDRVMRIVVDGRVHHRDDLKFSEKDQMFMLPNAENGDPYGIRDIVVPMRSLTNGDTYSLREASRVIDKAISDYLSEKLPEPEPTGPNVISELYPVFTPFLCKIIYDLVDAVIDINQLKGQYDDVFVRQVCAPYEYILAYDPTQTANELNKDYVIVHPIHHDTVMAVDIYHYKFLERVIAIYMAGKVKLSHFLRLTQI